jgi:anti-anti-sigma regulatory factor
MVLAVLLDIPMYRKKLEINKEIISEVESLIVVKGHLYIFNIDKVTKQLLSTGLSTKTTIDFSGIESIDASAVERINKTIKACKDQGNEVLITGATEKVENRLKQLHGVGH